MTYFSYIINVKKISMKRNNKLDKANAYRLSQEILRNKALAKGVNLIAPETIFLSSDTLFGKNVTVEPYVVFGPKVKIGDNSYIKSFSHVEGTKIEKNVVVGPYARLRSGTVLKDNSKIGNFVETKKSNISQNSKINHLSYVGDTSIGKNSNIGAGTITCNYDGKNKLKCKIGDNTFIGSNTTIIAPVKIGRKAYIAAGSVITKTIPSNHFSIARSKQKNKININK